MLSVMKGEAGLQALSKQVKIYTFETNQTLFFVFFIFPFSKSERIFVFDDLDLIVLHIPFYSFLSRVSQYTPMKPKPNAYLRRSQNELEPLYRRAKYAAQLRESVKTPILSSSSPIAKVPSQQRASHDSVMYYFESPPVDKKKRPSTTGGAITYRRGAGGLVVAKPYGSNGGLSGQEEEVRSR